MNRRGTGTTIVLVILVIICLFQGAKLSEMEESLFQLNDTVSDQKTSIRDLQYRVNALEESLKEVNSGLLSEANVSSSYTIKEIDWENGIISVDYIIRLREVTEDTALILENSDNVVNLERVDDVFCGMMEYKIKEESNSTMLYLYEGDRMIDDMELGYIGASELLSEIFVAAYDGYVAYGNDRITLSGQVKYLCNIKEKITTAEFVCGEERKTLEPTKRGVVDIVTSQDVGEVSEGLKDETYSTEMVYLEIKTEEGYTYQMYPYFYAFAGHSLNMEEEEMLTSTGIYQDSLLKVITPSGKEQKVMLSNMEEYAQ